MAGFKAPDDKKGPVIFPKPPDGWFHRLKKQCWTDLWHPKHSQDVLFKAISDVLGDRMFGESSNRLVIPAFNAQSGNIQLCKTDHHPDYRMDCLLPATTVAMATSAAPTNLSAFKDTECRTFIVGGVRANCPVVVGLVEAISKLDWPRKQIDVLSIGTTSQPFHVCEKKQNGGIVRWGKGIVDIFQEAQGKGMLGIAKALTGGEMMRIDVTTTPGRFALDGAEEVENMKVLGEESARKYLKQVEECFLFGQPVGKRQSFSSRLWSTLNRQLA